ncbi:MAG: FAD-dependent oxidoreductase [Phycisphaeraceae bacterium]|nr:FAD-dependent oxidoreductase [Phycisphaeraceae bacterium]
MQLGTLIFGGGVAGMWLLDELHRAGFAALLLERFALGQGQTVACQGIIHGGLKYTLHGHLTGSARAIRDAPGRWRDSLEGRSKPDLTHTTVLADFCHLWRTSTIKSIVGAIGAKRGLRVAPRTVEKDNRPAPLRDCPGEVMRLDEQVIDPVSLLADLAAQHQTRIAGYESVSFEQGAVVIDQKLTIHPQAIVLTAGAGNAELRATLGLDPQIMQRRPLHMVMLRGDNLPRLCGHCVDGKATRVTITSHNTSDGGIVWQLGGQIAERGVNMSPAELIRFTQAELQHVLPQFDLLGGRWATYRVDRAEAKTPGLLRPQEATAQREGNVITAWPTKLAMAPHLAGKIMALLPPAKGSGELAWPDDLARPNVALPPWETAASWTADH